MTQDEALALLKSEASIFLTGEPGSGKTHTVDRYIETLKRSGMVLVGDFFQLPPVVRREAESGVLPLGDDAYGSGFAHASPAWRDLSPTVCYLSEQHRQSDAAFLDALAAIRTNACGPIHCERLAARKVEKDRVPAGCTLLFTHNAAVDEINQRALAKLSGETHVFAMTAKGPDRSCRR